MTRVLVCGGRNYTDSEHVHNTLSRYHTERKFTILIQGDAPGVDHFAKTWAELSLSPRQILSFPANWKRHSFSAGPRRNQQMLDEGKPDLVIAFPGGRGTADMVSRAVRAGIEVLRIDQ